MSYDPLDIRTQIEMGADMETPTTTPESDALVRKINEDIIAERFPTMESRAYWSFSQVIDLAQTLERQRNEARRDLALTEQKLASVETDRKVIERLRNEYMDVIQKDGEEIETLKQTIKRLESQLNERNEHI